MTVMAIMPVRNNLVAPLPHEGTATRTTDTASSVLVRSGAVSRLSNRPGDMISAKERSTPTTTPTPGFRTSTTAIRTTTTRTTTIGPAPSADYQNSPAELSFDALVAAYYDCRRTKRTTASALVFEFDLERNLIALNDDLAGGTYRPGPSICFVITRPKPREVWAAQFRDRIVHHLLYNAIGWRFEAAFIADSCACIPGRGTLYAAERLETKMRSITQNWSRPAWYLKCDLANFFVSIDKRILWERIAARVPESTWRDLAHLVLFHDPRADVVLQSPPALLARIQPHKSLFTQPAHLGLPIGNLSSQFFANVHLDTMDQYIKHVLKVRHYIRYVDDFVLLHESPQQLNAWHAKIAAFLARELRLELNERKTVLQPVYRGVDFAGQVIKPWRSHIRRRTFNSALQRVAVTDPANVRTSANSYFGLLRQATASHHDRARLANLVRRRGHAVDRALTKCFKGKA